MRNFGAAVALTVLALTSSTPAQAPDVLPFRATETTLANGLRVIVVPTGFPNLVSIQIPVQTGSRNEVEPGKSGFAHFFEHLMFRGTPATPPEKFRQLMTKAGARDNASTGNDATRYYATFAKEDLESILALYADMFQHLAYSEPDFKTEARAVLGEYNKNSADPTEKLDEVRRDRFFTTHPYKHTTMGFVQDIENMPNGYAYSKQFFERWYRPQNTTVIIAGDVNAAEVVPIVEKYWGMWKGGNAAPVTIPKEPPPSGPKYAHVDWPTDTLPWVSVAFLGPGFDEDSKDTGAIELLDSLYFGQTSDLYKRLVVTEQKVDQLIVDTSANVDPSLFSIDARVKNPADAPYVRDQILAAVATARSSLVAADRLAAAQSFNRYSFTRTIDSTERVAAVLSRYAPYKRSYQTVNHFYKTIDSVTPADLQATARKYFDDRSLIVTTVSHGALAAGMERMPAIDSFAARPSGGSGASAIPLVLQKSQLPQLNVKLQFNAGSAHDPAGKEGLAALTAAMVTRAGSKSMTVDQIDAALYPTAAAFVGRTDKEMTTLTALLPRDQWQKVIPIVLPQLTDPGWRQEDFERARTRQLNALMQDLRSNNEEELGKERLQTNIFRGTPYGHVSLGTVAGLKAITLDDVKAFAQRMYTKGNVTLGVSGDAPDELVHDLQSRLQALPDGAAASRTEVTATRPRGINIEIIEKDTRATAISFGFPIEVTRSDPDFAALSVARSWLGEHRLSSGQLYQRIREIRGMNYGDYAYIEAFPRGMFQFFPDPNVVRRRQIFEIWIRPVVPANAHMALRIAVHELETLVQNGLTKVQFEETRDYLMKNVYVMTARQDQQLGYAIDSRWYGIGEFTEYMRERLRKVTVEDVNAALKRHLTPHDLSVVIITKNAAGLKQALVSDAPSTITYDAPKPKAILDEDRVIGALRLNIPAGNVTVTPVGEVFSR